MESYYSIGLALLMPDEENIEQLRAERDKLSENVDELDEKVRVLNISIDAAMARIVELEGERDKLDGLYEAQAQLTADLTEIARAALADIKEIKMNEYKTSNWGPDHPSYDEMGQ